MDVSETPIMPPPTAVRIDRDASFVHESTVSGASAHRPSRDNGARRPSPPSTRITSERLASWAVRSATPGGPAPPLRTSHYEARPRGKRFRDPSPSALYLAGPR